MDFRPRTVARKGHAYAELGLADPKWNEDELIDFHARASDPDQPANRGVAEGRATLPAVRKKCSNCLITPLSFREEDGEVVVSAKS